MSKRQDAARAALVKGCRTVAKNKGPRAMVSVRAADVVLALTGEEVVEDVEDLEKEFAVEADGKPVETE